MILQTVLTPHVSSRFLRARSGMVAAAVGCLAAFGAASVTAQSSMSPSQPPSAQPGSTTTEQSPGTPAPQSRQQPSKQQVADQFQAADANGDGKLTKEEAKTGMPGVYRNFDKVDVKGQGFITPEDLAVAMKR